MRAALDSAEAGWTEADGDRDEIAAYAEELLAREKVRMYRYNDNV